MGLTEKYGDYVDRLLSVDYSGAGVYINNRALIGFSFLCFLARACCAGGSMVLRPHRSRHRPNKTVPPGHDGSDFFFANFSSHTQLASTIPVPRPTSCACYRPACLASSHLLIPSLGCLLTDLLFATRLLAYQYRPAPRPAFLDTEDGEVHGCDTTDGWRAIILLASCGWQLMATGRAEGRRCHDCLISLVRWSSIS